MICLMRVDDRLIHGQVQTSWIQLSKAKNIMVVDDEVSEDKIAQQILKFAMPNRMKLKVCNIHEAYDFWDKAVKSPNNILVLFKTISTCNALSKKGIDFDQIMVGPVSFKDGAKEIIHSTYFTEEEIEHAKELYEKGVKIYFQHTPDQKKIYWDTRF